METDPTDVCELLVGLGEVNVLGVDDVDPDDPIRVHVKTRRQRPDCGRCETPAVVKDRPLVELVDLPAFGRPARLVWRKHRWSCPDPTCLTGTWTEQEPRIAARRLALTDRAGRWVTFQVGKHGRTVNEVAQDLDCDWHTVNDAVIAYGTALIDDDKDRIGDVEALGLDETLFSVSVGGDARHGPPRSPTLAKAVSSTLLRAGALLGLRRGSQREERRGAPRSNGRPLTCRVRIAKCSTPCCPQLSRSPTHFTS